MIDGVKPYSAYKDSGVPWLGKVPEHWDVGRLKRWIVRNDSGVWGDDADPNGTIILRSTEQTIDGGWRIVDPARVRLSELQRESAKLSAGDLVITKSSGSQAHIGKTSLVSNEIASLGCCFSNFMQRLRMKSKTMPAFVWRLLNCSIGREQLVLYSTTTTGLGNLNGTILGNCQFAFPARKEQAAIVRFLDYADARIRRYIRAKQKMIKLLEEQKQAIIHRAVTRGLDPNVRLKPSGVEWLGDVPEHWEVLPARYIFRAVTRREMHGDEIKLSVTQRRGLVPTDEMEESSTQAASFERFQACKPGDLVLNKYKAHLGVFWAAKIRGLITPNYTVFRPMRDQNTEFFELLFHTGTYRNTFTMTVYGVTEGMSPLYTNDFYRIPTICPPKSEQDTIVSWIAGRTREENKAILVVEREIALVREFRTRLIADVVTGKLDVRDAAAKLPAEAPEVEPLDEIEDALQDETVADDIEAEAADAA